MNLTDSKSSNKTVSVIIHTYNEEKHIESCIESARKLTDKIIVVDMQSVDKTVDLAKKNGTEVYSFPQFTYVEPARKFGINKARTDWVFLLDADERITEDLVEEIKEIINNDSGQAGMTFSHYKIPRKNIFGNKTWLPAGKWLKHGGWWPDYQIRLINKKSFKSWPKEIHSTPIITGVTGILKNPIEHYFHGDLESMVKKTIRFEDIESNLLFKADKNVKTLTFLRKFLGELFRRLIIKFGLLDGEIGIIESIYQAFSKTITYLYLYEKRKNLPAGRQGSSLRSLS